MDLPNKCKDCEHLYYDHSLQDDKPRCDFSGFVVYLLPCLRDEDFRLYIEEKYKDFGKDIKENLKGELL